MKLKILKISVLLIITTFSLNSCKDAYDITQDGELSSDRIFTDVDDLKEFLIGDVYSGLTMTSDVKFSSVFTDECAIGPSNGGQDEDLHRFNLFVDEPTVQRMWYDYYEVINRANRLLVAAEGIVPEEGEEANYNDILAQARTIRAFCYIQLTAYYSTDMTDPSTLGVMKLDFVPHSLFDVTPRVSNQEIFDLIESDLNFAEANIVGADGYYFATPALVSALKARYYLYREDYPQAQTYAQQTISNSGLTLAIAGDVSDFYAVPSTSPYKKMFQDQSQGEIIFALSRPENSGGGIAGLYYFNTTDIDGAPYLTMGINLRNSLGISGDVRRFTFVDPSSEPDLNVYCIDKYPGKGGANLVNDHKAVRLAEMYLILAEVAANNNDFQGVATNINAIRTARNFSGTPVTVVFNNATEAWAGILNERRIEYCFEGYRYIDLKRLGAKANQSIDRSVLDDIPGLPTTIPITDHRFTLPIPLNEVQSNPTIQQNPGYSNQ